MTRTRTVVTACLGLVCAMAASAGEIGESSDSTLRWAVAWTSTFGGAGDDFLMELAPMPDGGVVARGQWGVEGKPDIRKGRSTLVRFAADGRSIWQWQADGPRDPLVTQIIATADGGVLAGGQVEDSGGRRAWIAAFRADGALSWSVTLDGAEASRIDDLKDTPSGPTAVVGEDGGISADFRADPERFAVYSLSRTGAVVERRVVTGDLDGFSAWRARFAGDGFLLSARRKSEGGGARNGLFLRRAGPDGDVTWKRDFPHGKTHGYTSLSVTRDGGAVLMGLEFVEAHAGRADVRLLRLSADGRDRWTRTIGGLGDDRGRSLHETESGMLMVGARRITDDGPAAAVMCLTPDGFDLWMKRFAGRRFVETVAPLSDQSVVMGGPIPGPGGDLDLWAGRFDERMMPRCG